MNLYRQDPHLPFAQGQGSAQPNTQRLALSFGFDRGGLPGPTFAPNSQLLPAGWTIWDLDDVLGAVPWVDAARREAVLFLEPTDDPSTSPWALAGIVRALPAAIVALPEFWIYAECGVYYQSLPGGNSADIQGQLSACGIALFDAAPATDPAVLVTGLRLLGDTDTISAPLAEADFWSDNQVIGANMCSGALTFGQRVWVRVHVVQGEAVTPGFSADNGEHWIDAQPKALVTDMSWIGFVGTASASDDTPANDVPTYVSCSAISVFVPPTVGALDEALQTQGGERTL
jgi:hypothetical protein